MSFSRLLRFSDPSSIVLLGVMLMPSSTFIYYFYSNASSSNSSSAPKIMVSTSTSSIALLGVMLMASSTFIYYFYSMASSSNSSEPKKEESSSNVSQKDRLFVSYELNDEVRRYALIGDDNENIPLTSPRSLSLLRKQLTLSCDKEWLGFFEFPDYEDSDIAIKMAIFWNLTVRESVGIVMPFPPPGYARTVVGFGVCPDTSHPKLVKICVNKESRTWRVHVLTLSKNLSENMFEGAWEKVHEYDDRPAFIDLIDLECAKVSAKGVIYFRAYDDIRLPTEEESKYNLESKIKRRSNIVISFDLKSKKFEQVCLPKELVHAPFLRVAKMKESLVLLKHHIVGFGSNYVCDVWTREDGANKPFTKMHTVKVKGKSVREGDVLECRNNGDIVIELGTYRHTIEVYKPSSGHISGVGITGLKKKPSARSYPLTPLLTDRPESDSIIDDCRMLQGVVVSRGSCGCHFNRCYSV